MKTHLVVLRDQEQRRQFVTQLRAHAFKKGKVAEFYMDAGYNMYDQRGNRVKMVLINELPEAALGLDIEGYTLFIEDNLLDDRVKYILESRLRR